MRHPILASVAIARGYFVLGKGPVAIGRSRECQLVVLDESVSRRHAQVSRQAGDYALVDLGSVNGTLVNGQPVRAPVVLAPDDVISLGRVSLRYLVVEGSREELEVRFDPRTEETDRVLASMSAGALLSGTFTHAALADLVVSLESAGHSGVLRVECGGFYGILRFHGGEIVEAALDQQRGEAAARAILGLERGSYAFHEATPGSAASGSLRLKAATLVRELSPGARPKVVPLEPTLPGSVTQRFRREP